MYILGLANCKIIPERKLASLPPSEVIRMFVSADNILTLSSYNKWGDPEVGSDRVLLTGFDGGRYPFPLSVSFGVSVQF